MDVKKDKKKSGKKSFIKSAKKSEKGGLVMQERLEIKRFMLKTLVILLIMCIETVHLLVAVNKCSIKNFFATG